MAFHERHQTILSLLGEKNRLRVTDLSAHLGVSQATVRRDLEKLAITGQILRTHGAATLAEKTFPEPPVVQRASQNAAEKQRIGKAAASLIQEGDAVFIGSGTTAMEVARHLTGRKNLTVITNALTVINLLYKEDGISLVSVGGLLRRSELSFIGHITEQTMCQLRPQKVVMGIHALSLEDGLTNDYLPEVSTDRVIIDSGPETILVADHTKLGRVSAALVAPVTAVTTLVTCEQAPPEVIHELQKYGIHVILC